MELYDLEADLSQTLNLAETQPEKAKELLEKLNRWRATVSAPMPQSNP
ncbi:MAG UNVERIFIED_CONTAM: hypothetical protein LVR18_15250 [Planctomycetaceae bacterium]